jgi:repressor LexA
MFASHGRETVEPTPRQREILDFVNDHCDRHGYPPTVREIGQAVGLTSSSTVHAHLGNLERLGLLRRDPTKPRALELVGRERVAEVAEASPADVRVLPIVGSIAAGTPILAEQNVEATVGLPGMLTASGDNFVLNVRGDSMIDDGILDGDYVVVRRQQDAQNGDIVAALAGEDDIADEATVKRFFRESGRIRLQPENDALEPIYAPHVQILGKVVGVFRRV